MIDWKISDGSLVHSSSWQSTLTCVVVMWWPQKKHSLSADPYIPWEYYSRIIISTTIRDDCCMQYTKTWWNPDSHSSRIDIGESVSCTPPRVSIASMPAKTHNYYLKTVYTAPLFEGMKHAQEQKPETYGAMTARAFESLGSPEESNHCSNSSANSSATEHNCQVPRTINIKFIIAKLEVRPCKPNQTPWQEDLQDKLMPSPLSPEYKYIL